MSEKDIHPNNFNELRSIFKYDIDIYNALYQLKTENEEDLKDIYKLIKTELIDSKKYPPKKIMEDILYIIPYNNRYKKSYLSLVKLISDEYHVEEVNNTQPISIFLFYKEYGIKLDKSADFEQINSENLDFQTGDTIYRAIMYNDLERFIYFTERDGFDEYQMLESNLDKYSKEEYSLLELCCYYGAVDCFKLLISKYKSLVTHNCLKYSFLGGNPEILSECLKYQTPDEGCMIYAIISHNIDFVTFLMNEHKLEINLYDCAHHNNLEALFVYFDKTNDINKCFIISPMLNIPSLCEYFLSHGANINEKNENGQTALDIAAETSSKEIVELLISHGANINEKNDFGETTLHTAVKDSRKEIAEILISHGANINEKNFRGRTALHVAALNKSKEIAELLI
ncbi:hypothetical protein TVAG_135920 [Trichomonas vaginalis G3]|uniref:DUF3447 domain-containing protein n=1 Tax=Trichomonas vaginalis (strain ATCC PRA-98 / G3) TaxID=412133 RepID=A2DJ74_TRIV3|nr:proteasome regulatory particle assembly [Trichomonas vaginalis G3]EAY19461.1 hypothetical protein TVAG_135920 [Trichomonas vaginalis G3]KAI5520060.1 proteasome regulatory particle assembly [Trichomonas vaginalis G3]|eukprot:XP_001580447.1 hypothetical protein [Trichomonas vaginalis G3]